MTACSAQFSHSQLLAMQEGWLHFFAKDVYEDRELTLAVPSLLGALRRLPPASMTAPPAASIVRVSGLPQPASSSSAAVDDNQSHAHGVQTSSLPKNIMQQLLARKTDAEPVDADASTKPAEDRVDRAGSRCSSTSRHMTAVRDMMRCIHGWECNSMRLHDCPCVHLP